MGRTLHRVVHLGVGCARVAGRFSDSETSWVLAGGAEGSFLCSLSSRFSGRGGGVGSLPRAWRRVGVPVAAPKNRRVAKTSGRLPEKYVFRKTSTAASNAWNEPRQRSASPAVPKPMSPLTRSQGLCARRESRSDRRRKILPLCRSRARAPRACARCRAENRRALQARARRPDPAQDWKAPRG